MFLQIPFDFAYPVALDIEIEDFSHDLGLLRHDLQDAVRPFCVAEELRVVQHGFPISHAVTDPLCFCNPYHISGHNKTSTILLNSSISWRFYSREAIFQPCCKAKM